MGRDIRGMMPAKGASFESSSEKQTATFAIRARRSVGLDEYRKKRDFRRTPEPQGQAETTAAANAFVVQRHAARRLHYDFRLELDGVLKSWAVPKGPSLDPKVKSLAVEVEDHPIQYGDFEGVIPPQQYGGGTVMLFDRGTWEPLDDARKGLRAGKLKFRLHGQRLQGKWALVRSSRQRRRGQTEWLLFKLDDDLARPDDDHQYVSQFARSVATDRSMEQIASDADRVWSSDTGEQERKKTTGSAPSRAGVPAVHVRSPADLPRARRGPCPQIKEPQLATLVDRPPQGPHWLHELKLDGYRLMAVRSNEVVRLITRRGNVWTDRFPTVVEAIGRLGVQEVLLDGEVVIVAPDGTTDFQALQNSLKQGRFKHHVYYVFDVLYCDGYDLTQTPLESRKQFLADLLGSPPPQDGTLRYSDHVSGQGAEMYQHACRFALEGIVSKRVDGRYVSGRSRDWLKSKCLLRQEFVIVGFTRPKGARGHFGALLLGYYDSRQRLVYCGRVGTGFTAQSLRELGEKLRGLETDTSSLDVLPSPAEARDVTWVRPELVAEVQFAQWTDGDNVRQASFQGLREDKEAKDVGREITPRDGREIAARPRRQNGSRSASDSKPSPGPRASRPSDGRSGQVAGVRISNPNKILYPEQDITKLELGEYYERVAQWILPHLVDRPLSLVRCPQGRSQKCFYQKHVSEGISAPIHSITVTEKSGRAHYLAVSDVAGLVSLVQLGVLEIHPWGSRKDRLDRPDRLVIDLDPGPGVQWEAVVESAHLVRELLVQVDLESFVRTTGGKGLHVVVPLVRRNDWAEAKDFARTLSQRLAGRWPEHYVANASRAKRQGKIYVDYLRNDRGATAIASYSTRARPGATVAVPLHWDEVTSELRQQDYHIRSVPERLATLAQDPWQQLPQTRQWLTPARRSALAR